MLRNVCPWLLVVVCIPLCGCGGGDTSTQEQAVKSNKVNSPSGETSPRDSVQQFLQAVKDGDDQTAEKMLTSLARKKTAEFDIAVAPPGSQTATFEIIETELIAEDSAHVASRWTDYDESGQPHSDELVWMVRREPEGWRIAGMAARLFPEEPPLFLNFEDPEDMIRKQELAAEEIRRRASASQTEPVANETDRQAAQTATTRETVRQ